ncbi:MAG: hypothetical protein IPO81_09710 [Kouleothrix sp.]|nr:hypothetical protein [Kouleothrix sp.]
MSGSEEVAMAIGDIAYWKKRAETAERKNKILTEQLEVLDAVARLADCVARFVETDASRSLLARLRRAEADVVALREALEPIERHRKIGDVWVELSPREWEYVQRALADHLHPGRVLLAELYAARKLRATAGRVIAIWASYAGVLPIDIDLAALAVACTDYDRAGGEGEIDRDSRRNTLGEKTEKVSSIGRIVHFMYGGSHVPAIITDAEWTVREPGNKPDWIGQALTVFLPNAAPFTTVACEQGEVAPGTWVNATWHWPNSTH